MRVKCINKFGKDLSLKVQHAKNIEPNREYSVSLNKNYIVYGILLRDGIISYCICDDHYIYYPLWHPADLFSIIDGRLSKFWICYKESEEEIDQILTKYISKDKTKEQLIQYLVDGITIGTPEKIIKGLNEYVAIGVDHFILHFKELNISTLNLFQSQIISKI